MNGENEACRACGHARREHGGRRDLPCKHFGCGCDLYDGPGEFLMIKLPDDVRFVPSKKERE